MIIAKINSPECAEIAAINPRFAKAVEFINSADLQSLPVGSVELMGKDLYYNVVDCPLKSAEKCLLEVHDVYYDIQIPVTLPEGIGLKPRSECSEPIGEMNSEKDILKYSDSYREVVMVYPGEMIVLAPEDGHAPCFGQGDQRKIIFKVKK
jgi:YhcH/YjgK/YiaL family protein